jgi:hypothetical protein
MGSDGPPDHYQKPQGFSVSLQIKEPRKLSASFTPWQTKGQYGCRFSKRSGLFALACWSINSAFVDGQLRASYRRFPAGDLSFCYFQVFLAQDLKKSLFPVDFGGPYSTYSRGRVNVWRSEAPLGT